MYQSVHSEPSAHDLARGLSAKRVGQNQYVALCPAHDDRRPSFSIAQGRNGKALVHCHTGCSQDAVLDALRDRGLWPESQERQHRPSRPLRPTPPRQQHDAADRAHQAQQLAKARWLHQCSVEGRGTLVETYLRSRGIDEPPPSTLRFLPPRKPSHHPAMIAAFGLPHERRPGELQMPPERIKGVHLTLLKPDGSGKAGTDRDKLMIGPSNGCPIVIAPANDMGGLTITEGIEDALSLHQATDLGAWASGAAGRLPKLADKVPMYVEAVTIAVDDDVAGRRGAYELARCLHARDIDVFLFEPTKERRAAA